MSQRIWKKIAKILIRPFRGINFVENLISKFSVNSSLNSLPMIVSTEQLHPGDFDRLLGTWAELSEVGLFKENRDIYYWYYGVDGTLLHHNIRHLNNVGLFSQKDYCVEKELDDFLICVLGDEQSTSTLNEVSWPELLEDLLNEDVGFFHDKPFKRFKVLNFSWPDSGFPIWHRVYEEKIKKLNPDFVVLNFLEHSFERLIHGKPSTLGGKSVLGHAVEYEVENDSKEKAYLWVAGAGTLQDSGKPSLANPNCNPASTFQIYVSKSLGQNPSNMKQLREKLLKDYNSVPNGRRVQFSSAQPDPVETQKLVETAAFYLRQISKNSGNFLVTRNFFCSDLFPKGDLGAMTQKLIDHAPDLKIVSMRDRVAQDIPEEELRDWYLSSDHSKWSYKGHKEYARLMVNVIKDEILSSSGTLKKTGS